MKHHKLFNVFLVLSLVLTIPLSLIQTSRALAADLSPTNIQAVFFGGSGDQRGTSIAINGAALYVGGTDNTNTQGLMAQYTKPGLVGVWNTPLTTGTSFASVAIGPNVVYGVGGATPPACNASDGMGDPEGKSNLARYSLDGNLLGCQAVNFFPYQGGEYYLASAVGIENGSSVIYAVGWAETTGFGNYVVTIAKYDTAGNLVNRVTEPGVNFGGYNSIGASIGYGVTVQNNRLYVVGESALTGLGEDSTLRPMIMQYDLGLTRQWKQRSTDIAGRFLAVTVTGTDVYAVGYRNAPGTNGGRDYLIQKFTETGTSVWSQSFGGGQDDELAGVAMVGNRLFAVGYTKSEGAGGADAVIMELNPANGQLVSKVLFGGAQDDLASGMATDGTDLYVVGESRSFTQGGNAAGQNDAMLLRYALNANFVATSAATEVYPGDSVPVALDIQGADNLYAAQANCTVDSGVLQLQNGVFGEMFDPVNRIVAANQVDAAAGIWLGAISQQNPAGPLSGDGNFATLTYQASAPGTTAIACEPLLSDRNGFAQGVTYTGANITVLAFGILKGTVQYQGRLDAAGITVTAAGVVNLSGLTNSAGAFSLNQLKAGTYQVRADAPKYLPRCSANIAVNNNQNVTLSPTTLLGGDLNDDDTINIGDASRIGSAFGTADPAADVNGDGIVNVQDLAILAGNYDIAGCQGW
jgi:hypothetical protein